MAMKYSFGSERIDFANYANTKNSIYANHQLIYKHFAQFIKDGTLVIDAGCGFGISTQIISELKPNCKIWATLSIAVSSLTFHGKI